METPQASLKPDESARTTSRTSAHSAQLEIITRGEPRRSWTLAQKQEIVAESFGPELTPTEVARKHAISSGQLYTWRQQLLGVQPALVRRPAQHFAQVDLEATPSAPHVEPQRQETSPLSTESAPARPEGLIEVVLPCGTMVRMDAYVDARALRRVLGVLDGR
jgi:transposase